MRRLPVTMLGVIAATALLTSCSASDTPDVAPTDGAPSAIETDAETDTPTAEPAGRSVPDECAALSLAPGTSLSGADLGECVAVALSSYGSGRMEMTGEDTGVVEFTYDPAYAFQGTFTSDAGEMSLVFVDGEMWMDTGSGPVRGDLESDDPQEQLVGVTAEFYRLFSDLEQTAQLIQGQPTWTVAASTEDIALPDGSSVVASRITSDGGFTWNEIPVSEFVLWFGEDWVPVATQATVSVYGMESTQSQRFYDLGAPITVEAPK